MIYSVIFASLVLGAVVCAIQICRADFRRRIIPDAWLFPLMLIGLVITAFWGWPVSITDGAVGATIGYAMTAGVGALFTWVRRHHHDKYPPVGMGDIKLMGVGGLWLGTSGLAMATIIACAAGAIWAWRRNTHYIPFAPFFIGGAIIALIGMGFLL